ncbi:unnamed protein product [Cylicocyclus nassatus]|uniref:PDZ domain-containing protein n=1 Tax=Cylicocyclus nassatus TaxID=53992 RepID=A0AA36HCY4_CYLNA|nr:unnamed protein product [Cylicocyclus nassatus]
MPSICPCPPLMCSLSEEEKVFRVLRELRERAESADVREDVEKLEKLLNDPLFRQYSRKSTTDENTETPKKESKSSLTQYLRDSVEKDLLEQLKDNQKLHFVDFDVSSLKLEVLDPRRDDRFLLIAGPKDVKARSAGLLRIGDRIAAIAGWHAADDENTAAGAIDDATSHPEGGPATRQGGAATLSATATLTPPHLLIRSPTAAEFRDAANAARSATVAIAIALIRETTSMVLSGDWTQVEIIRLSTEGGGLGFGIVGGTSTGVVVKTILPGSPADKDRRLRPGDHVLQIGNISTHGMSSQQVATILRQQDSIVEMIVGRPINYADRPPDNPECWTMSTRAALCAASLEEHIQKIQASSPHSPQITPSTVSPSVSHDEVREVNGPKSSGVRATSPPSSTAHDRAAEEHSASHTLTTNPAPSSRLSLQEIALNESKTENSAACEEQQPEEHAVATTASTQASTSAPRRSSTDSDKVRQPVPNGSAMRVNTATSTTTAQTPETPVTSKISLRALQEMALTVFLRENWQNTGYETVDVTLLRDPALGLGITVAGYVHRKEEIGGVFVKSLVPRSAAAQSGQIRVHDLILEVNGMSLEHLSHADSVRTLVRSGENVHLRLIRFPPDSAQAQCLKMLQEQETDTQVIDVQSSNPGLVSEWKRRLSNDVDIVTAIIRPDSNRANDGGLGIALEGTVDVVKGHQLCPHHYIESIRHNGPAAVSGLLQAGDELLQVNHSVLYGESHVTVRQALSRAVHSGAPVTLVVARRTQHVNVFQPSSEKSLPASYPLLASGHEKIVKAKSEVNIPEMATSTDALLQQVSRRLRARSLEPLTGLAVWNCVPLVVCLEKDERGLGFSIVDYQDPAHPGETVIVVQSLVPGGLAQSDGRIVPGDRLLFVNQHDLSNSSLERAVAVLKAAPLGRIRIGIAKPIPIDQCRSSSHSPIFTRSERLLARGSSPRGRRRQTPSVTTSSQETVWIGADQYRRLHPQSYYPSRSPSHSRSDRSLDGSDTSMTSWSPCSTRSLSPAGSPLSLRGSWAYDVVYLPTHLERSIKITKGALPLGIVLDADKDKGVNGAAVKSICSKKAIALDGRIQVGDYVVRINQESLRNVTSSQARAILRRTNLIGTQCNVTYITSADARMWKERFHRESEAPSPVINRLSPKIFPKFYRSPYMSRKESLKDADDTEPPSESSELAIVQSPSQMSEAPTKEEDLMVSDVREKAEKMEKEEREEPEQNVEKTKSSMDQTVLDDFVQQMLQESLRDAVLEVVVSSAIPDWKERTQERKIVSAVPSSSHGGTPSTPQHTPVQSAEPSTSGSPLGSPDRQGSPPYTVLHKESQSSPSSNVESRESEPSPSSRPQSATSIKPNSMKSEKSQSAPKSAEGIELPEPSSPPERANDEHEAVEAKVEHTPAISTQNLVSENLSQAKQVSRSKFWGEARTVVLQREPNKSFGISIVGGRVEVSQKGGLPGTGNTVSGIFIKSVLSNSPAGRSGMMNMGDRVISVNDIDLREATHEQAVNAIKNASNPVRFVLQSLHSFTPQQQMVSSPSNSTIGSAPADSAKVEEAPPNNNLEMTSTPAPVQSPNAEFVAAIIEEKVDEHFQLKKIEEAVERGSVSSRQSVDEQRSQSSSQKSEQNVSPSKKSIGSTASELQRESPEKNEIEKQSGRASIAKDDSMPKRDSLRSEDYRKESGPLIVSDVSSSEAHDEEPSTSCAQYPPSTASNAATVAFSAADLSKDAEDPESETRFGYTSKKIQRKYGHLPGDVMLVSCEKVPEAGLGISLAGNRDRDKNSTFVLSVKVQCPLTVRAGDELLEVNGRVLVGQPHIIASSIIRQCCEKGEGLEIVLCRRNGSMEDVAVRSGDETAASVSNQVEPMPPTVDVSTDSALHNLEQSSRKKSCSVERTAAIETGRETLIEIDKDGKGLGLSIVGGSDTVLGTVVIHEVYPDGAAAHDGRLKPGDQVLEVNNVSLRGVTHDQAISALRRTPPKVRLLIYRDVNLQLSLLDPTQIYNMFEVELVKKPGRGLGLSIVGRKNEPGVYVSEVVKGGAAEADNRLMTGDQILAVNGQDVANSMQEDVAAMLKTCVGRVCLKVGRWKITETANRVHAAAEAALARSQTTPRSDDSRTSAVTSERKEVASPAPPVRPIITHTSPEGEAVAEAEVHLSPVTEEPSSGTDQRSLQEEERHPQGMEMLKDLKEEGSDTLLLELKKIPDQQLGMGIGKRSRGILVTSLQPGSAAAEKLKVGDRILAVNALPVTDQLSAVTFVKASGPRLFLQIARPRTSPQ